MLNIAALFAGPRHPSPPRKTSTPGSTGPRERHFVPGRPARSGEVGLGDLPSSTAATTGLYTAAQFESMMGAMFVIRHQAARVSGVYLCCCFVRQSGAPLLRHVKSTIKQRGLANSLLQSGELNAITRVFVTDLRSQPLICHPDGCYKVKRQGHAFPGNYLLPAIILRILWFSFILSRKNKAAAVIKRRIN